MARKGEKVSEATRLMVRRALTKYKQSYVGELINYFMSPAEMPGGQNGDTVVTVSRWNEYLPVYKYVTTADGESIIISTGIPVLIPTKMGFCKKIGISLSTFYSWCQTYPEFRSAWEECREWQIELIESYATAGVISPSFAKYRIENYLSGARRHPTELLPGSDADEDKRTTGGEFHVVVTVKNPPVLSDGEGGADPADKDASGGVQNE